MNRREALKNVAILLGTTISASTTTILFEGFTLPENEKNAVAFTDEQKKILTEMAEIIMPTTKSSPGAKAAGVGKFIPMMVNDCYPAKQQQRFAKGLGEFEERAKTEFGKNFLALNNTERTKMLIDLRLGAIAQKESKDAATADISYFFTITRDLTLLGYFASEIGCTQARAYLPIPGRYDGSVPLKPGQKSWAT